MIRIKFLFSGNFDIENKARHFEKNEEFDASNEDARRLIDDGSAVAMGGIVSEKVFAPKKGKVNNGDR
jgi:hypothetical protein